MNLSVVIPVLDEAKCLGPFLEMLRERLGEGDQIIVVDGGSSDNSALIAREHADLVLHCDRGRARQMNLGAERAVPMYNVMGPAKASLEANVRYMAAELGAEDIRVNAISAGPIKTLAAAGIKGFRGMLSSAEQASPLGRNVSTAEVGNAASFLCSPLASGITGQILYVDAGYHILGLIGETTKAD